MLLRRAATLFVLLVGPSSVVAQSGVSDDRVSVPDGPGSIEGLGDNATVSENMGLMSYGIAFELPQGFPAATPSLGLAYSSGNGNSVAGIGFSLHVSSVERFTLRGLPEYDASDELAADGVEQLVRVSGGMNPVYRARVERAFVRYTWVGAGAAGYMKAEYPDGSVGFFGATQDGAIVSEARLAGPEGQTFRYNLVERVDVYGHTVRYGYSLVDGSPYLTSISYVFDGNTPRYTVALTYAPRPDPMSDAKPRFEERITQRLAEVSVRVSGEQIRRYVLTYESAASSGGLSRLVRVQQFGRDGTLYPVVFSFAYSRALGGVCTTGDCAAPFVVNMGSLQTGGAIGTGDATLVDINGDALPDVLDTTATSHRFVINVLDGEGRSHFDPSVRVSAIGKRNPFQTSLAYIQPLDVNGDGLADLVNTRTGSVLCNRGTGDWVEQGCVPTGALGLELEGEDSDPTGVRFFDVDGDRRIDAIHTPTADSIEIKRNTSGGFVNLQSAQALDVAFDQSRTFLADINGDGLLDPVHFMTAGGVRYRVNLGFGHWTDWRPIAAPALSESQRAAITLEDLNGDGLDDLVLVEPMAVKYALNRSGVSFDAFTTLTAANVPGMPSRGPDTTVLYADMNGNGAQDIVWVDHTGVVQYLELFPVLPNLLSRIENGLGMVQTVDYGTAAGQRAEPGSTSWAHLLPISANVVTKLDTWTTLTGGENGAGLHEITLFRYRDGFYDGIEKQFRGFARVETVSPEDGGRDDQEAGRTTSVFDVGATNVYRSGLLLEHEVFTGSGASERALVETRSTFSECAVAGIPTNGLAFPIRHVCETETLTILKEGAPEAEWATTRTVNEYDGYGRITRASNLGVVHRGPPGAELVCGTCVNPEGTFGAACGPSCLGDESFTETTYIEPGAATGGLWLLGKPEMRRAYGAVGGQTSETRTYYDGPAFVGLAGGQLTRGDVSRVTAKRETGSDATVPLHRAAFDAHGNVVAELDPLGMASDDTTHRRSYVYDASGLRIVRTDVHLTTPEAVPYRLRREYSYDLAFDQLSEATGWMIIEGNASRSARKQTSMRYDAFGRRVAIVRAGDTEAAPSMEFQWLLGNPASRIVERTRSTRGGEPDLERVTCVDGRGRTYQTRARIAEGRYQVSGFAEYNSRGALVRSYQPYTSASGFCDTAAPSNVLFSSTRYDALGREIRRTEPDAETYGTASSMEVHYAPLAIVSFDPDDLDPASLHARTPTLLHRDGLGRTVAIERRLVADAVGATTRAAYDGLGRLVALRDAEGNTKTQTHDLLGRPLSVVDPSSGTTRVEYDDASNVVARTDARGVVVRRAYDGANRLVAEWDEADPEGTEVRTRYDFGGSCAASNCTNAEAQPIEVSYPIDDVVVARLGGAARGVDHFGFDARAQPTYAARTVAGTPLVTRRVFDNAGRVTSTTHPDGRTLVTRYDGASRPVEIAGVVTSFAYDDRGAPTRTEHANGVRDTWAFDERARLTRRTTSSVAGDAIEDVTYERDRVGNITRLVDSATPTGGWRPIDARFTYDAWYRVVEADYLGNAGAREVQSRTYDSIDNARSVSSTAGASSIVHLGELAYDAARPNAVVSAGGISYGYDEAGYMVGQGDVDLTWDHLGRLTRATRDGLDVARFSYGSGMSRVARIEGNAITIYASDDYELRDGIGVLYARIGRVRLARRESGALATELLGDPAPTSGGDGEVNAADAWVAHASRARLLGANVISADPASLLRGAGRRLLAESGDGEVALHSDHLGSIIAATSADGLVRGRRSFIAPAGEERQSGYVDAYGFSGQESVESIGLVRFQYRWLDPRTLRWTSADPAFEHTPALTQGRFHEAANRFAYVGNGFVNGVDPTGLMENGGGGAAHGGQGNGGHANAGHGAPDLATRAGRTQALAQHHDQATGDLMRDNELRTAARLEDRGIPVVPPRAGDGGHADATALGGHVRVGLSLVSGAPPDGVVVRQNVRQRQLQRAFDRHYRDATRNEVVVVDLNEVGEDADFLEAHVRATNQRDGANAHEVWMLDRQGGITVLGTAANHPPEEHFAGGDLGGAFGGGGDEDGY